MGLLLASVGTLLVFAGIGVHWFPDAFKRWLPFLVSLPPLLVGVYVYVFAVTRGVLPENGVYFRQIFIFAIFAALLVFCIGVFMWLFFKIGGRSL